MTKYQLISSARYRLENTFVLVCDCKKLLDYRLPKSAIRVLDALVDMYDENQPVGLRNEGQIITDLLAVGLIYRIALGKK